MKKSIRFSSLIIALAFLLASCSNPASSGNTTASTAEGTTSVADTTQAAGSPSDIPNFNPTGYPICPDEKVTLRVLFSANPDMPADLNDIPLIQQAEEIMNVHIDYIAVINTGFTEKKNLMLATGDLPDIIESQITTSDLTKYGPDGTFIPMQDLIKNYAPNFTNTYKEIPALEAFITAPDGNIYGLARINSGPWMTTNGVGIINKKWLDTLGLQMPTNLDEFRNVLTEFKAKDPNGNGQADEIPFTFRLDDVKSLSGNWGISYFWSFFGLGVQNLNEAYVGVRDGKIICQATLPEMKEATSYLADLYKDGLVDMEGFTMDESAYRAKLNNDPGIVGYTQTWDINDIVSNPDNNAAFEYMPLLKGPNGREPVFYKAPMPGIVRGWGTITKACKTPEVAMRWLDFRYDPTNSIEHNEGPIGVRVLEQPDGTLQVRTPPDGLSVAKDRFTSCTAGIIGLTPSIYRDRLKLPSTDKKVAFVESFQDIYGDKEPMYQVYYTEEEATELSQLQTDIRNYIDRKLSEWIMNGNIEQEWDAYLVEIDKIGLPRWIEIKQAAYDRFMANM